MDESSQVVMCINYLRPRFKTVAALEEQETAVWSAATREVTLTSNSYEGGAASGQVSFDKKILLLAIQSLLKELAPTRYPNAGINVTHLPTHFWN